MPNVPVARAALFANPAARLSRRLRAGRRPDDAGIPPSFFEWRCGPSPVLRTTRAPGVSTRVFAQPKVPISKPEGRGQDCNGAPRDAGVSFSC
jgi:hypothetical protein